VDGAAAPKVERVATAHFTWLRRELKVDTEAALQPIETEVSRLGSGAARTLLTLELGGAVPMTELARIEERLGNMAPQLFHLAYDMAAISVFADAADLEALSSPSLADIARRLKETSERGGDDAAVAARALRRLFTLARQSEAGARS